MPTLCPPSPPLLAESSPYTRDFVRRVIFAHNFPGVRTRQGMCRGSILRTISLAYGPDRVCAEGHFCAQFPWRTDQIGWWCAHKFPVDPTEKGDVHIYSLVYGRTRGSCTQIPWCTVGICADRRVVSCAQNAASANYHEGDWGTQTIVRGIMLELVTWLEPFDLI